MHANLGRPVYSSPPLTLDHGVDNAAIDWACAAAATAMAEVAA